MDFTVVPLHKHLHLLQKCCDLINSEWKRSDTARLRSLEASCDHLPVSLILLRETELLGHLKLSPIPSVANGCFVETVVIDRAHRGKGLGTVLMKEAEKYCKEHLGLKAVYLSTRGQEGFYSKLGYVECKPISIYGGYNNNLPDNTIKQNEFTFSNSDSVPKAPPMPDKFVLSVVTTPKTYMIKHI